MTLLTPACPSIRATPAVAPSSEVRQARQVLQQRTLILLFGLKQRRPFLELDENERVDRRRQMRERLAVLRASVAASPISAGLNCIVPLG